jgi:hypothetical protein
LQERRRNGDAELARELQSDRKLDRRRLLDRQVTGLGAAQQLGGLAVAFPECLVETWAITDTLSGWTLEMRMGSANPAPSLRSENGQRYA